MWIISRVLLLELDYIILVRSIILVFWRQSQEEEEKTILYQASLRGLWKGFYLLLSSLYLFYVAIDFLLLFFKYVSWLSLCLLELQGWIDLMNYIFIFFRIYEWFDFNWVLSCVIYVWSPYIMFGSKYSQWQLGYFGGNAIEFT